MSDVNVDHDDARHNGRANIIARRVAARGRIAEGVSVRRVAARGTWLVVDGEGRPVGRVRYRGSEWQFNTRGDGAGQWGRHGRRGGE